MGCSRAPTKDYIQFCKSPKKKNNLIQASILFYSRLSPTLTAPETIQYCPPCAFCWLPSCPIHPPSLPRVFGWLSCLFLDWGPPKTTSNFGFLIFLPLNSTVETMQQCPPPSSTSCTPSPQKLYSFDCADSRLVVVSLHPLEAIESQGPIALSVVIFTLLNLTTPSDGQTSPPTRSTRSRCLSNVPSTADIIVGLVVAFLHRMAAAQDHCSAHFSIFRWVPLGRPNQPIVRAGRANHHLRWYFYF
jgi:hypothetical protein